jgi:hypothetical protein
MVPVMNKEISMSEFKSWSELSPLEQASAQYWDMYKDAYGVRPRWIDTTSWTLDAFEKEFESLAETIRENIARQELEEKQAIMVLENRIASLMQSGAKDRSMAIRWIAEAEDAGSDMEYLCFLVGVPYGYFKD